VLREVIHFEKGGVKSSNFDDYKLLKMSDTQR
jgi:CO/xanthine dehydrogenase Mo-binding subunit